MQGTSLMGVPETTVHEDGFLSAEERDIWSTGYATSLNSKPVAKTVKHLANGQFGLRVSAANARHVLAALLWRQRVGQGASSLSSESLVGVEM